MKYPKDKIIIALFLIVILLAIYTTVIFSANELSLSSKSAALYEPSTGSFLYLKNADIKLPMASTTKIMTAIVAIENSDLNKKITVDDRAIGTEGSSLYLKHGEKITMSDLLYGLMLRSANDAAEAIAYAISGSIDSFADLMNETAENIGLSSTHFTNPHGLDDEDHYTTARELALISAYALKNETFSKIVSTKKAVITSDNNDSRLVVNHNKLLNLYDGAIGVKTGFTKKCGRCLVGAAIRDGLTMISVTINAPDDWSDHEKLLDFGFSKLEYKKIVSSGEYIYNVPVLNSSKEFITVKNEDEYGMVKSKGSPDPKIEIKLSRYFSAPIKSGDKMGEIVIYDNDVVLSKIDLVATEDAKSNIKKRLFS